MNHFYRRLTPGNQYLISHDQREDLYDWLSRDYWCKKLKRYTCVWCDKAEKAHKGAGLCSSCYYVHRRLSARLGLPATVNGLASLSNGKPGDTWKYAQARLKRGFIPERELLEQIALEQACSS